MLYFKESLMFHLMVDLFVSPGDMEGDVNAVSADFEGRKDV